MGGSKSKEQNTRSSTPNVFPQASFGLDLPERFADTDLEVDNTNDSLTFHNIHGKNITLSEGNKVAQRINSFCYGIVFSSRPIRINEVAHLKLEQISHMWSGLVRFGVTCIRPEILGSQGLPRFLCPDLTNQDGIWAKALSDEFANENTVISFHVNHSGELCYMVNGTSQESIISGIPTEQPLWVVMDVYGNSTALKFVDELEPDENNLRRLRQLISSDFSDWDLNDLVDIGFSCHTGKNIRLSSNNVYKIRTTNKHSIVFSDRAFRVEDTWHLKVGHSDHGDFDVPVLRVGVTNCNPESIDMESWSGETNDLLDRFEYWVLQDVFPCPRKGDFFSITITDDGFVSFKVLNSGLEEKLFFCDTSQPLWIIIDMRGSLRHLVSVAATVQTRHGDSDSDINFDLHDHSDNLILSDSPIIYPNHPISLVNNPMQDEEVTTNDASSSSGAAGVTPDAKNKAGKSPNPPLKDSECSLCVDAPANIAVYDCGHVCLCEACSKKLLQVERFPKCPICRKMIKDVMKIYRV